MDFSSAEENYLKAIYHLSEQQKEEVSTNSIADELQTKPASVSDMLKKLAAKKVINYVKYKGVTLTNKGRSVALWIVRKHRLWEVFLVEKLKFNWDEVHEVAEQLEHIKSRRMIERLDKFLGFPKFDPHGDPIPDKNGNIAVLTAKPLAEGITGNSYKVVSVSDSDAALLQYLDKMGISIGTVLQITDKIVYDSSIEINIEKQNRQQLISKMVSENILVVDI
ncbi:metal-dependent transcriptional regulator [Chondrinema litorale]|uniref:metal-dependent transcriptional regulator n=1 Tax=Chondrinema litorale TaxID=2994555 RepID=UPI002543D540|nr:metal-dependent transcriptional regulator [Chondrinema litorale]UZR93784.1 metal-dependent transcriptional regulator [Chondrinema litorale]